jgi:AAA+ superfamily predicted ATPase
VDEAKEELREGISSCAKRRSFRNWADGFRRVLLVNLPEQARPAGRAVGRQTLVLLDFRLRLRREVFVGVGASRVRICSNREKNAPCIIFIDEMTLLDVTAAPVLAAGTTSANRL